MVLALCPTIRIIQEILCLPYAGFKKIILMTAFFRVHLSATSTFLLIAMKSLYKHIPKVLNKHWVWIISKVYLQNRTEGLSTFRHKSQIGT